MVAPTGKLAAIDSQVDVTTGTVRLKAVFENEDGMLFPNQFVNARLLVDTQRDAVVVPAAAVQRGPNSTFVYVIRPDETAELRDVVTGPTEGAETAIVTGLVAGEVVVTDGIDKLNPDAKVSSKDPAKDPAKQQQPEAKAGKVSSLLQKGDRHLAAALFPQSFDCCSEPVPLFQEAVKGTE